MASRTEEDHLWALLTSDEVKSIECSKFIDASPDSTNLPESINSVSAALLKNITFVTGEFEWLDPCRFHSPEK